ncbi:hypothetical protein D5S17_35475 [Pseudonocardiaceae bacterium YIM PH 21723]|nr:hypothetical protein D5S17_35475 [Pseudonocardiaceae bacterium YIM PH 21723]
MTTFARAKIVTVQPRHIAYAVDELANDGQGELVGISVAAYSRAYRFGSTGLHLVPKDWSRVTLTVHGVPPLGAPVLRDGKADPRDLTSWELPEVGTDLWDRYTVEWHPIEPGDQDRARALWHRLTLRAAHAEKAPEQEAR